MKDIPLESVQEFQADFLDRMRSLHKDVLEQLSKGRIDDDITNTIREEAASVAARFKN